jgi:hypothetical protein
MVRPAIPADAPALENATMNPDSAGSFDFAAFKRAFTMQDLAPWIAFFAEDAQWIEYRHGHPPASPRVLSGRAQIAEFLVRVKGSNVTLAIEDEVVGPTRAAFRVWCTLSDGKRVVERSFTMRMAGSHGRSMSRRGIERRMKVHAAIFVAGNRAVTVCRAGR